MPLWLKSTSAASRPKYLVDDEDSDHSRSDSFATTRGWEMRAGTKSQGNDNTSADPEVLVAIGDLAGSTDTTGLRAPTVTHMRFIWGTSATQDGSAADGTARILVEITWDEAVTVAGSPQIVVDNGNQSSGGYGDHTLTYTATGSTANRKRFVATSRGLGNADVLTIGGTNLALNSGTISDTVRGGTSQAASLVLSGLTAVTHTVTF